MVERDLGAVANPGVPVPDAGVLFAAGDKR